MSNISAWTSRASKAARAVLVAVLAALLVFAAAGAAYATQVKLTAVSVGSNQLEITNAGTATNNIVDKVLVEGTAANVELASADDATDAASQVTQEALAAEIAKIQSSEFYTDSQKAQQIAAKQTAWQQINADYLQTVEATSSLRGNSVLTAFVMSGDTTGSLTVKFSLAASYAKHTISTFVLLPDGSIQSVVGAVAADGTLTCDLEGLGAFTLIDSYVTPDGPTFFHGQPVYCLHNAKSQFYFYTADENEVAEFVKNGWINGGVAWGSFANSDDGATAMYRLYNSNSKEYYYTGNTIERGNLVQNGWEDQGIAFYAETKDTGAPVYRLYNTSATVHFYTMNAKHKSELVSSGWRDEGIGWYAVALEDATDLYITTNTGTEGFHATITPPSGSTTTYEMEASKKTSGTEYNDLHNAAGKPNVSSDGFWGAFEVTLKEEGTANVVHNGFGKVELSFPVGIKHDGKVANVYHRHDDGSVTSQSAKVANGKVSIETTDLSTFAIYIDSVMMYRMYNSNSGEHFYTSNERERNYLIEIGWRYEGIGWIAPAGGNPVYRLYNKNGGEHHYTLKSDERDMLINAGWRDEGIGWYSDQDQTVPLYREYNPNQFSCNHNYTKAISEHNWLVSLGWRDEGIAWYALG